MIDERKILLSERQNLFEPNDYICVYVQFQGGDNLKEAVEKAIPANETTMSKIVLETDGTAYYEKLETSGCSIIEVKETASEQNWKKILRSSFHGLFARNTGRWYFHGIARTVE